jgi:hypothetical protein
MKPLSKIEKTLLALLILAIPLQRRHIFFGLSPLVLGKYSDFVSVSLYASDLIVLILLIYALFKGYFKEFKPHLWLILTSIAGFTAVFAFSPRETYTWLFLLRILEMLILAIYIAIVARGTEVRRLIYKFLTFSGLLQSLIALGQFLKQSSLGLAILGEDILATSSKGVAKVIVDGNSYIRSYGTFPHPNLLAGFLVVACATTLYLMLDSKLKTAQYEYGAIFFILTLALFSSLSRSGMLGLLILIIGTFSSLFATTRNRSKKSKENFILIAAALVLAVLIFLPFIKARSIINDSAINERLNYDRIGGEIIKEDPILGHGLGTITMEVEKHFSSAESWQIQPPHNYFIIVACETGLVGLIMFLSLYFSLLIKLARGIFQKAGESLHLEKTFVFSLLIGIFLMMMFDHYFYTLQQTQLLLWLIIGIAAGVTHVTKEKTI